MDAHDTRVDLEPENKIVVGVGTTDCEQVARDHIKKRGLDEKWLPTVTKEVRKAVVYACKRSIDTMSEARSEVDGKYRTVGERVLGNENEFLRAVESWLEEKELKELQMEEDKETEAAKKGEEKDKGENPPPPSDFSTEEILEFLKNRSPVSVATLNAELNALKMELQQHKLREKERKARVDAANGVGEEKQGEEKSNFAKVDADGDGRINREEWRSWADAEIKFMKDANEERAAIIVENRRLRTALTKPSESQKEDRLRAQDQELAVFQEQIVSAQLLNENLQAELKIARLGR